MNFSSNVTQGFAPITVYTYFEAGNYSVNLTTINQNGTDSKRAKILVQKIM
ncbi:MAG TPA: hypothetical protein HA262_15985 [Methanosarcina sp.]|nr:hypothetical protein [Methanosarcina sp.]